MPRYIRSENNTVSVAQARTPAFSVIPPFFYSGIPDVNSDSGLWYPPGEIIITSAWASARVSGSSATVLAIQYGDNAFDVNGTTVLSLALPASGKRIGSNISPSGTNSLRVSASNWIRVVCTVVGGHEDIAVQINADYIAY